MMTEIRPLKSEADYDAALVEIEQYFDNEPEPGTLEADRFDLLALVIGDYEAKHWGIEAPDAPDALRERMETRGLTQQDLAQVLGSRSRASEVMNRRRHLTLEQAWKLHREWDIPADALIRPYPLRLAARLWRSKEDLGHPPSARGKALPPSFPRSARCTECSRFPAERLATCTPALRQRGRVPAGRNPPITESQGVHLRGRRRNRCAAATVSNGSLSDTPMRRDSGS